VTLAARADADAIIAITRKGRTARLLSSRRPRAPIYAFTGSESGARQLALWWGVKPVVAELADDLNEIVARTVRSLRAAGQLPTPSTIVVVSGSPDLEQSGANFVRLRRV